MTRPRRETTATGAAACAAAVAGATTAMGALAAAALTTVVLTTVVLTTTVSTTSAVASAQPAGVADGVPAPTAPSTRDTSPPAPPVTEVTPAPANLPPGGPAAPGVPAGPAAPGAPGSAPPGDPAVEGVDPTSPAPAGRGAGEELAELARLSAEAGALGEELHLAREELDRAVSERDRLDRAAGVAAGRAAVADGDAARDQQLVDHVATMRYRGGDTGPTRAAVLARSPGDLVARLDVLRRLSGATTTTLDASRAASTEAARLRDQADLASRAARVAAQDARDRADRLDRDSREMARRIDEVRRRVDALTEAQRAVWVGGPVVPEGYVVPEVRDVNTAALNAALTRLGAPYSWGATGPDEFDCSGLMVWAYAREGKALPRSSQAQAVSGMPVAPADISPGDLVIYYPGATHVGMYAGDGLVLHAPTYGVPVRLERVDAMPVSGIRRY